MIARMKRVSDVHRNVYLPKVVFPDFKTQETAI